MRNVSLLAEQVAKLPKWDAMQARLFQPLDVRARYRLMILAVLLLLVQIALFVAIANGLLGGAGYGVAHAGSCLLAWHGRHWVGKLAVDGVAISVLQIVGWTALAGPFGTMLSVALLAPPQDPSSLKGRPLESGEVPPTGSRLELLRNAILDSRLPFERAQAVKPLFDVLTEGTQSEKFEALSIIAKSYEPALAPVLMRALADVGAPVRVLAATVLAKLRAKYIRQVGAMQSEVAKAPDVPKYWRELARARLDLAQSGLLDTLRSREEIAHAQEDLARAAAIERDAPGPGLCSASEAEGTLPARLSNS